MNNRPLIPPKLQVPAAQMALHLLVQDCDKPDPQPTCFQCKQPSTWMRQVRLQHVNGTIGYALIFHCGEHFPDMLLIDGAIVRLTTIREPSAEWNQAHGLPVSS